MKRLRTIGLVMAATFCATRPATMLRSSAEKTLMLFRTCSAPKTASTISCTL
jgi:hypothetical protein